MSLSLAPEEEADLLQLAARLVAIPSVSRAEEALAGFVEARLRARGRGLRVDRIGNCYGRRKGRKDLAPVMSGSHIDSVPTAGRAPTAQEVATELAGIWKSASKEEALTQLAAFKGKYRLRYPEAIRSLCEDEDHLLTFYAFPQVMPRSIRSTNAHSKFL